MAAITLIVVAFFFLPYFLRTGIFTIPQFLEHRYNAAARSIMAGFTMVLLIGVYSIAFGVLLIVLALRLRSMADEPESGARARA